MSLKGIPRHVRHNYGPTGSHTTSVTETLCIREVRLLSRPVTWKQRKRNSEKQEINEREKEFSIQSIARVKTSFEK